ncbi:tetratricopeptide repeat protein [Prochlorococcus sp. MIT 0801]|uniref:tetratricopeptide repeat protein n=1 Tax=Prochlorococcus sp. MIT 0801 TaxID=1501269 RepID=UPI0004F779A0|nr:tetratricopeptide repeat protein [Prochlorococcus sp. MIT 0801]AIQ98287.1 TPR repeat [Prochlorococcus sp. MIT 0801]
MSSRKTTKERLQKALDYLQIGQIDLAEKVYLDCIDDAIENNVIYANLGAICLMKQELKRAVFFLKKALFIQPKDSDALNNLAIAYKELKNYYEAFDYAFKSIRVKPSCSNYYQTLALIYLDSGDIVNSIRYFNKVLELEPNSFKAYSFLGRAFKLQNQYSLAIENYQKALLIRPNHLDSIIGLGNLFRNQFKFELAINYFEKVINIQKDNYKALHGLAITYGLMGFYPKAKLLFEEVLLINPNFESALINLGHIEFRNKCYVKAITLYQQVLSINPLQKSLIIYLLRSKAHICDWSDYSQDISLLENIDSGNNAISPMLFMSFQDKPNLSLSRAKNFFLQNFKRESKEIKKIKKSKIRIAYFSANFNNHPVTLLIRYILKLHNRDEFEVFAYSYSTFEEDEFTWEIRNNVDKYIDIKGLDDLKVLRQVREDSIDIAIDLMGFTTDTRFALFSYRLAPIQISYLGYPGTTGSDAIDYLIADRFLIPESHQRFYSEEVIYLPNTYLAHDDRLIPKGIKKDTLEDFPKDKVIFTSFNANYKISKTIFDVWIEILLTFEESILWIYASNELSKKNLILYAEDNGLNAERLIFSKKVSIESHLNRHQNADVFLDTFCYSSGATAWLSLASGVPIVTLCGNSYTARMSSSLLQAIDMTELITYNLKDYKQLALKLARDKDYLHHVKSKLKMSLEDSSIFNSQLFTKELDNLYKKLYIKHFNT